MHKCNIRLSSFRFLLRARLLSQNQSAFSKWNYAIHSQRVDLGRQVFETAAINDFTDIFPEMSALVINDVVQSLTKNNTIYEKLQNNTTSSMENSTDIFAKLGEMTLTNKEEGINAILGEIKDKCITVLTKDDISMLVKQQHPKAILSDICREQNMDLVLEKRKIGGVYEALFYNSHGEKLCFATNEVEKEAERNSSLQLLTILFREQFKCYQYNVDNLPLEEDVTFGISRKQRSVSLTKTAEEPFGFSIQGGEQRVIRDENYIQRHTVSPVFISHIETDSPADKCGLRIGDVLLSVGDHSLKDATHSQAVVSLKKFLSNQNIEFLAMYDKNELLKYQAAKRYLEREKEKIREEMSSNQMGKWHQAKAKTNPDEYFLEEFKHKKRHYQPHKAKKSVRLWDYPYKK